MGKADIILIFLITASSFQILCLSFVILVKRNLNRIDYIVGLIFFLYGAIILCNTSYREGTEYLTVHLLEVNSPLVYFLAPLLYINFMVLLHEDFKIKRKHLFLFLPGVIVLLGLIPFFTLDAPSKMALYPFTKSTDTQIRLLGSILKNGGPVIILISFLFTLRSTFFLWNKKALVHIRIIRLLLLYIVSWILLAGVFGLADLTGNILLYRIAYLTGNIMLLIYFLFMCRNPDFFSKVRAESKEIKYLNSRIRHIDAKKVITHLESLMVRESIYRESALYLKNISDKLDISAPQLSELLNKHYDTNFSNYINSYRVEEVKKVLEKDPGANILQTAFDCGFNSKAAFNSAFRKFTNMTPSQYRNKIRSE